MRLEGFFYSSALWRIFKQEEPSTCRAIARNRVAARVPLDDVHLGFVCHAHSFPQARSEC
jgi:hypothetical protein